MVELVKIKSQYDGDEKDHHLRQCHHDTFGATAKNDAPGRINQMMQKRKEKAAETDGNPEHERSQVGMKKMSGVQESYCASTQADQARSNSWYVIPSSVLNRSR